MNLPAPVKSTPVPPDASSLANTCIGRCGNVPSKSLSRRYKFVSAPCVERLAGICQDNELPDRSSLLKKHDVIKLIAHIVNH